MVCRAAFWYLWDVLSRSRVSIALLAALLAGACSGSGPSAPPPFFSFSRITVQDLAVRPSPTSPGADTRIRFRLVRSGGGEEAPIYWTSHLLERPAVGGVLSETAGGPLRSGGEVELTYSVSQPTVAVITLYPSSVAGVTTGDGSGDWLSFTIDVRPSH